MKKASRRSPERDRFVRVARLRRIIGALSGALDGDFDSLRIEIDGDTGKLVEHDGEGNHAVAFWNEAGVVALQYEHDVPEAHGDTSPAGHLAGVPKQLVSLAEAVSAFEPRRATRGAWALGDEAGGDWFEMHMLEPHTWPADEAAEMGSALSTAVVLRAEEATRVGTYTMSEADFDAVFATKAPNLTHVPRP
jgi:hypothetical protein